VVEEIAARDALAEACEVLGPDARVLEPSPPAVTAPPWFADDPTGCRPLDYSARDGDRGFCEERWLGPYRRLQPLPEGFAATRVALHGLAQQTLAPARAAVNGKIGLRWTLGGFGTPFFGADEQLRVEHGALVHQRGESATRAAVSDDVVPAAASALGDFYGFATSVLEALRAAGGALGARGAALAPSRVQLWPEHFDVSLELGSEEAGRRAGYGASPGDDDHPEPYLYVVPWSAKLSGRRWQAHGFVGAELGYRELVAAADQRALALAFFQGCVDELQSA
jgi:hypothetical protein